MASVFVRTRRTRSGVRYHVMFKPGGRDTSARYAGSFKTRRLAAIRAAAVERDLVAGVMPTPVKIAAAAGAVTFEDAAARWLSSRIDVSANTILQNRSCVLRAGAVIGPRPVAELTADELAAMIVSLHRDGVAVGYLRKIRQAVAMVLDHARIDPNPARDKLVKLPRSDEEEVNPPTADHLERVLRLLPTRHRLAMLFLDWSGARVGAIDHLLVGDYDEPRRRVRLRASTTKMRRALWIDLPADLADAVEQKIGPRDDRDPAARLFADSGSDALRTAIAKACKAASVPLFSPHDLRHRRISLLHLRGMPWAKIGEFVGQRSLKVTADTYTHVLPDETELDYRALLNSR